MKFLDIVKYIYIKKYKTIFSCKTISKYKFFFSYSKMVKLFFQPNHKF